MSFANERKAIEAYFKANYSATAIMWDGHTAEPVADSVRLTILNGAALQGTVGMASNRVDHVGIVAIQIFTDGGAGSQAWRGYADTITALFSGVSLDTAGATGPAPANEFIRFSPAGEYPSVVSSIDDPPFHITTINAPYTRYE